MVDSKLCQIEESVPIQDRCDQSLYSLDSGMEARVGRFSLRLLLKRQIKTIFSLVEHVSGQAEPSVVAYA